MIPGQKYSPPKVMAVDVDGTLVCDGRVTPELIAWLQARKADGFRLMLWSARGRDHAAGAIATFDLPADLFDDVISKPGYVLDNCGWEWTRFTQVVKRLG
jgi:hydroxymethylpyrimidine pyrophosphatase-like HAD family hydrolase